MNISSDEDDTFGSDLSLRGGAVCKPVQVTLNHDSDDPDDDIFGRTSRRPSDNLGTSIGALCCGGRGVGGEGRGKVGGGQGGGAYSRRHNPSAHNPDVVVSRNSQNDGVSSDFDKASALYDQTVPVYFEVSNDLDVALPDPTFIAWIQSEVARLSFDLQTVSTHMENARISNKIVLRQSVDPSDGILKSVTLSSAQLHDSNASLSLHSGSIFRISKSDVSRLDHGKEVQINPQKYWKVWYDVVTQRVTSTIQELKLEIQQVALDNGNPVNFFVFLDE